MLVVTYDGTKANREDCANIKGDFYKIGDPKVKDSGQCYPIESGSGVKRYRINSGYITWDWEKEEYVIINGSLANGLTLEGNGYFTPNKFKNVYVRSYPFYESAGTARDTTVLCLDEKTARSLGATLSTVDGYWYLRGDKRKLNDHRYFYRKVAYDTFDNVYNLADSRQLGEMINYAKKNKIKVSPLTVELYKFFNNISFGVEIETSSGRLQDKDLWYYGLLPIRDGSIPNHEYVSIPAYDEQGLEKFVDYMTLLQETCRVDQTCSLHIHLGNVVEQTSNPKLFLVTLYILYYLIQKEVWDMIPPYKKSTEYLKTKQDFKDHCQDIKSLGLLNYKIYNEDGSLNEEELEKAFNILFTFWNDGYSPDAKCNYKTRRHVRQGANKWEIKSRYHNINMYNAMFSKSNTIEYRGHGGTTNLDKSLSWLLICVGITRFAMTYSREILTEEIKPSLNKILSEFTTNFGLHNVNEEYATFVSDYLKDYFYTRQNHFNMMYLKNDIYGKEFAEDPQYKFNHKGMSLYEWEKK